MRIPCLMAALAIASVATGAHAAPETKGFALKPTAFICPAYGWLTNATDEDRMRRGACIPTLLRPSPIVPMDASMADVTFVCFPVLGLPGGPQSQLVCGYALNSMIVDSTGRPATSSALRASARAATMADVWALPAP